MKINKKGYSTGFTWVFALVSLFGLGILYIVFSQVFNVYLAPTIIDMVNQSTIDEPTKIEVTDNINKYLAFFNMMPFIIFLVIILYMGITAIRKEREDIL